MAPGSNSRSPNLRSSLSEDTVGAGFSDKVLASLYNKFEKLKVPTCPFINMKRCQWVKPVLVARVKFTEWTHDGQLRQPVFLGLRTDKGQRMSFANKSLEINCTHAQKGFVKK